MWGGFVGEVAVDCDVFEGYQSGQDYGRVNDGLGACRILFHTLNLPAPFFDQAPR